MIRIQKDKFNFAKELDYFSEKNKFSGSICSFLGKVRKVSMQKKIKSIFIEHYEEMTFYQLKEIIKGVKKNWKINDYLIIHRHGEIDIGENIVLILVASQHRSESLKSLEYIIDWLKVKATFWKKEISEGNTSWVSQNDEDKKKIKKYELKY